jgi:hypothetical protein
MFTDILKAYGFARETRELLLAKFSADRLSLDELKVIVADLDTSPPGIPGLARSTFAFTLLLLLGVILFHLMISGHDIPPGIEKMLTLLGTALTSIIAFYFGARSAETAAQNASVTASTPTTPKQLVPALKLDPDHGKIGDAISIKGSALGVEKGAVKFGKVDLADIEILSWADTEIKVKVPAGSLPGKVQVVVTPKGKTPVLSTANAFNIET